MKLRGAYRKGRGQSGHMSSQLMGGFLLLLAGLLGGTHPGGHPGCRALRVPVLPRPGAQEEAGDGLSQGLGGKVPGGGGGRRRHQTRLRPHRLPSGESREKGVFPGHGGRSAVLRMTITCAGSRDQSVEGAVKVWRLHLGPVRLQDLGEK